MPEAYQAGRSGARRKARRQEAAVVASTGANGKKPMCAAFLYDQDARAAARMAAGGEQEGQ